MDKRLEYVVAKTIEDRYFKYLSKRGITMSHYQSGSKVLEEAHELIEALKNHMAKPTRKSLLHLQEEVADMVIASAAAAHEFEFTVEEALDFKTKKDTGRNKKKKK